MKKFAVILTLVLIAICGRTAFAQKSGLDKDTFVKAVKILEKDPFVKDGKKIREAMTFYLIETKDVSVVVCTSDATQALFDKKYKFSNELFSQNLFGMAAFKLENPDKAQDEIAAQIAGAESVLQAYEAMLKTTPKAKFAVADDLIGKRDNGTLAKFIADNDCSKK